MSYLKISREHVTFANQKQIGEDKALQLNCSPMTPEQEAALQPHIDAIGKILYEDSDPEALKTLEGIETTIRGKLQQHVSPQLGAFLFARSQARKQDESGS
jgi:hypothetical protein